ncbi:MAG: hypothetical protein JJT95_19105 [Pararhodobacter sp.]|nr:hypothetical protein [Pararhodobacter sp.]
MAFVLSAPRLVAMLLLAALVGACTDVGNLSAERAELGDFRLGHNIVVATNAQRAPVSRPAESEAWEEAIRDAVDERFSRYEGTRLYHIAVSVDGYLLAPPGVPLVASPRSALIIGVHVWDDELGRPINEERRQLTVLEGVSGESLLGSGLTRSADEQMTILARNAARSIENWMAENSEWFNTGRPPRPEMLAALAEREAAAGRDGQDDETGEDEPAS